MAPKAFVPLMITLMLATGVCNTLLTKFQDNICVRNCDDPDPTKRNGFEQPVIQTLQMFIGEMGSWLFIGGYHLYKRFVLSSGATHDGYEAIESHDDSEIEPVLPSTPILRPVQPPMQDEGRIPLEGWKLLLLSLPAICDICGTTLMNVGLLFVVPSIYQMTRGALVLFVGLFSVFFLKRNLHLFQWFALVTVFLGVGVVGFAGAIFKDKENDPVLISSAARTPEALRAIIGVFLIAGAQVFSASQFVLEEYILEKYALDPLKVVGWEGLYGFSVTLVGMLIMHLARGRTPAGQYGYFDIVEGWREITLNRSIAVSSILIMISIGGFNYFGLSVTRNVSATARSTIDTCRTLFIWIISLFLGWETFKWLQVLGFALLVYGTFLFNGLVRPPLDRCIVVDERLCDEATE
ncbi:hypothetical protein K3495_g4330 [Podosphaera aphanis]|nr:hypothetical protein K3495_g4330 [Podosphaera aphanis]